MPDEREYSLDEWKRFRGALKENAIKIAPDYPGVETCDIWDDKWAIVSAYEGTDKACDDLHKMIDFMRIKLGWTKEQVVEYWEKEIRDRE